MHKADSNGNERRTGPGDPFVASDAGAKDILSDSRCHLNVLRSHAANQSPLTAGPP